MKGENEVSDCNELSDTPCSTGDLFKVGLDLKVCADSWVGEARLIGNIKASELSGMAKDYTRLRLQAGISESLHGAPMSEEDILEVLKKHGVRIELGAIYSVKCQIAQLLNAIREIETHSL